MFLFVDDFDKRDNDALNKARPVLDDYIESGSLDTGSRIVCCSCHACKVNTPCYPTGEIDSSSYMLEHAFQQVIRMIEKHQLTAPKLPSCLHMTNGIVRSVTWGHDVGDGVLFERVNNSKMEELKSVPEVMEGLLCRYKKRTSGSFKPSSIVFATRGAAGARLLTLTQFKSILSDNRKHAKSVWNRVTHITLCPWAHDGDEWRTIMLRYDASMSPTNEVPDVAQCRSICNAIKKAFEPKLKILSGRFSFYKRTSDDQTEPWWLGDVSELRVSTVQNTQAHAE